MKSLLSLREAPRFLLFLTVCFSSPKPALSEVFYVDICGLVAFESNAVPGILVEARRCSDDAVVVSRMTDFSHPINYHLVYEEPDDGKPGGQFQDHNTPIPVYLKFYLGCTNIMVSCAEVTEGYNRTTDGKLNIDQNMPCVDPYGAIGDSVFDDTNANGVRDFGEPGLPGVSLKLTCLLTGGGSFVASTNTDANGNYLFVGVPADSMATVVVDSATVPAGKIPGQCPTSVSTVVAPGSVFLNADFCYLSVLPTISIEVVGSDVQLKFNSVIGWVYQLESAFGLEEPTMWVPVANATNIAGTGGILEIKEPINSSVPRLFYRLSLVSP